MRSWLSWIALLGLLSLGMSNATVAETSGNATVADTSGNATVADTSGTAAAQATSKKAPRILEVFGPRAMNVGSRDNYRVRIGPGAEQPVVYRWDMGDGTKATGNNISHAYARPGRYTVKVTARNERGRDSETLVVVVTAPAPVMAPVAEEVREPAESSSSAGENASKKSAPAVPADGLRGVPNIDWSRGGYTLVAFTCWSDRQAEEEAIRLRRSGYRAGIIVDDQGPGSKAYRVVIGQFSTSKQAVDARRRMVASGTPGGFLVHELPSTGN